MSAATVSNVAFPVSSEGVSIWLSDDEMDTWYIKEDVITGGYLSYPCPLILDNNLVFSYDHNRRQARFVRVTLPPPRPTRTGSGLGRRLSSP